MCLFLDKAKHTAYLPNIVPWRGPERTDMHNVLHAFYTTEHHLHAVRSAYLNGLYNWPLGEIRLIAPS